MRHYTYADVTDAGWITPAHGLDTITLTMVVLGFLAIIILVMFRDK